ncbi:MAG: protein-L-isoaspartate(D-aspartate) O-methyltransferase [Gammaproteobacteria bacterium]|jgi:protein-L-isoaspartate(D-aspartate) O-methyltransferase
MKNPQQQRMLDDIEAEVRYTRRMIGKDALDARVMRAMAEVPRNEFVPKSYLAAAFDNGPLPIGHGQTISQPYIVALMTDLLELEADDTVLEIGTGSGYQTAILAQLCRQVYTVEYIPALADMARARFDRLGYTNIESMSGNGYNGWPEHAPYDGIIITAAASHIPKPLVEQLKPDSRMVIPLGRPHFYQELTLVTKDKDGELNIKDVLGVAFVPLQGERDESI